jgi:YbbR domain-containing protein
VNPGMNILSKDKKNDNMCNIKIQTANRKQSLTILLQRNQRFDILLASCAEQLGVKESSLKLYFDGEQISPTDTPESLDLEEEACVDLHVSV